MRTKLADDSYIGPDEWIEVATSHEGSWWVEWMKFLASHSGQPVAPPSLGSPQQKGASFGDAPGIYVLEQ